jgi:hypothetical protein
VVFEVGVALRSWGRIPALEGDWELVDKRVHAWHELKQNAEIGNVKPALNVSANVRLSRLHHLYISII